MAKGGKREGAGPKLRAGDISHNHSIKFTDAEWILLSKRATLKDRTISEYVRRKALD